MIFRGLKLDLDNAELRKGDININKPFFNPFEDERNALFNETSILNEKEVERKTKKKSRFEQPEETGLHKP